jgi:hypothetical protein
MSVQQNWPYPVGKLVARDGCLTFGQRRFWSQDSMKFAGKWVSVRRPGAEDQMVTFWHGDEEKARKYVAHLMADTGFADFEAARAVALRRIDMALGDPEKARREQASIIGGKIAALVQLLDERVERARQIEAVARSGQIARLLEHFKKLVSDRRPAALQSVDHGHLQMKGEFAVEGGLSQRGIEYALVLFDVPEALFERFKAELVEGHKVSPAVDGEEPTPPADDAHRLSGGAK